MSRKPSDSSLSTSAVIKKSTRISLHGSSGSNTAGSSSAWSRASFTPTEDGHETPFAEFAWSVQQLCKRFWPSSYEEIAITHVDGGSFNRIVGLSVKPSLALAKSLTRVPPNLGSHEDRSENYILRISREEDTEVANHIMTLFYIRLHSTLPVPRILAFDIGSDNTLEKPFTLQQRIKGVPLNTVIDDLTFDQRLNLVDEIASIINQMQEFQSSAAGKIGFPKRLLQTSSSPPTASEDVDNLDPRERTLEEKLALMTTTASKLETLELADEVRAEIDDTGPLQILHYDLVATYSANDHYNGTVNNITSNNGRAVLCFLNFQFARHILHTIENCPSDVLQVPTCHRLMQVLREMDEELCLGDDTFNLFHSDLEPRNIMVHIDDDDAGKLRVTGVLDWDSAAFVPRAVSCLAPRWVWSASNTLDSHQREDERDPIDLESVALKGAFDSRMSVDWEMMAYEPQYRLLRRIYRLAISGFIYAEDHYETDKIINEWPKVKETLETI